MTKKDFIDYIRTLKKFNNVIFDIESDINYLDKITIYLKDFQNNYSSEIIFNKYSFSLQCFLNNLIFSLNYNKNCVSFKNNLKLSYKYIKINLPKYLYKYTLI